MPIQTYSRRLLDGLLGLSGISKQIIAVTVDSCVCVLTVWLAFYLRLGEFETLASDRWPAVVAAVALAIPLFAVFGLYRAVFRRGGASLFLAVVRACVVYGLIYASVFVSLGVDGVPRTIGIIQPILLMVAVIGTRALAQYLLGGHYRRHLQRGPQRDVLIYGAGSAGQQLFAALNRSHEMRVRGFLDDDVRLRGRTLDGKRIFGTATLKETVERLDVTDVLLALPSATRKRRNEIIDQLSEVSVSVRTLPGMNEIADGRVTISDLKDLDIEDLLGREAVPPDSYLLGRNIADKVVLVTGAGGSIGSELCRQIMGQNPTRLLLVENSEFALYAIHRELEEMRRSDPRLSAEVVPLLASVTNADRIKRVIDAWKPQTIYHAAAYKHVPLVEHNVAEGIKNNSFGTIVIARAAAEAGVETFVLISTDKAVRPTNIMGASKRCAEMALQAMAAEPTDTRFLMVRFGNVLGSSGSVVPLFRRQIVAGGPLTITHPEMTRYFMTIPEAAQLVIQASAMAEGGEVFVLDMGEPVRIVDLARTMIRMSGLTVCDENNTDGEIELQFVGLRPGEKMYEELLIGDNPTGTGHSRIMKANEKFLPWAEYQGLLELLRIAVDAEDIPQAINVLNRIVPEFTPDRQIVDWISVISAGARAVRKPEIAMVASKSAPASEPGFEKSTGISS